MFKRRAAPLVCTLLLIAVETNAKPPKSNGFIRLDELEANLDARLKELREQEEFEKKPRPERLVILLKRGVERYEKRELTGELVVEEVYRWKALEGPSPTAAAKRALGFLPEALDTYYKGYLTSKPLRVERYRASKMLVDALDHERLHVRRSAIACLKALHGIARGYDPAADRSDRRRAQKKWKRALRS